MIPSKEFSHNTMKNYFWGTETEKELKNEAKNPSISSVYLMLACERGGWPPTDVDPSLLWVIISTYKVAHNKLINSGMLLHFRRVQSVKSVTLGK